MILLKAAIKTGISAFAAGVAIGIGGTAYLATGYAWMFPIGLFIVCFYNLHLFTGRICYYSPKNRNLHEFVVIYVLNTIGAYLSGMIVGAAKPVLAEDAGAIVSRKMVSGSYILPVLAFLCNVLIFVAVDSYKRSGGFLGLIFATTAFVACGFEHCIANAFYFGAAGEMSIHGILFLLINAIWNAIGGITAKRIAYATKGGLHADGI